MIKLLGVLIIVVGFALKLDTIAVVLTAGVVTGIVGGLSFNEILTILGEAFVKKQIYDSFLCNNANNWIARKVWT
jgi:Predicted membrane protein